MSSQFAEAYSLPDAWSYKRLSPACSPKEPRSNFTEPVWPAAAAPTSRMDPVGLSRLERFARAASSPTTPTLVVPNEE